MFEFSTTPETDPGEWIDSPYLDEKGKPVRFRIRRIPELKALEIETRNFGRKRDVTWRRGGDVGVIADPEAAAKASVEKATYALCDSERCAIKPKGPGAIVELRKLGLIPENEPENGAVILDGRWTPEVKALFLNLYPTSVARWIADQADAKGKARQREDEEGKET